MATVEVKSISAASKLRKSIVRSAFIKEDLILINAYSIKHKQDYHIAVTPYEVNLIQEDFYDALSDSMDELTEMKNIYISSKTYYYGYNIVFRVDYPETIYMKVRTNIRIIDKSEYEDIKMDYNHT